MNNTTAQTETITIPVDAETAKAYQAISEEEKRKIAVFLRIQLKNALDSNGLTPEILQCILEDE